MATYEEKAAAWDRAVDAVKVPDGTTDSLDVVTSLLEKQLDRAIAAIKTNDDKAALAIPSVGVLAGIVGSNVRPDIASQTFLAIVGGLAAVGAVVAICMSMVALRPESLSNGVVAVSAVTDIGASAKLGKLRYLKSLGFTVQSAEDLVLVKAFWVNWAFRVGAVAVVLLTIFAAFGGFAPSGGSGK